MSEHGDLQFVWDIMLQSEWWKQYSEMVDRSLAEQVGDMSSGCVSSGGYGSGVGSWSGSWNGSWSSGALMGSGIGSGLAAGAEAWWASSSGSWWMEIPEAWWSSFSGSWWASSAGSGVFGSGCALGYGLQLI